MIHWHIHEYLLKKEAGYAKAGDRIIELGEQFINIDKFAQHTEENPLLSANYYINRTTIPIDINPQFQKVSGCLKLDLSKSISTKNRPEPGDIVTDFGTIEHIKSLYWALKNAFNLLKIGGYGMHVNPVSGGYLENHGFHYFTEDFWRAFANLAKLDIKYIDIHAAYHNHKTGNEIYCVYQKTEKSKFPTKQEFDRLYKLHIRKS